ncbi:MbnP family protein [Hymenobacter yonginensis]|uniref:Copper-binding protein MbnP-like domain-containing protein n=1 Tax=Hymenobacter yonginensis TaxID=748197 RepID=A0ABY7PQR7_9BACT|nr:MbnP family protein [Hymenobacter yonginensis]WBO85286.1 hypothetical protein O9Z63_03365 [Hymenobacter yonginensis]
MKFLKYTTLCLSLFAATTSLSSCDKDDDVPSLGKMSLEFENVVGTSALQLNSATPYQTPAGDQFTVSTFRYYISNIKLKKADGTEFVQPESYYLIDEALPASKTFSIPNIPTGDYTGLTFTIGVDSARNVSGVQTGALAPGDMFWSWNSGYIYTKLEGRSPQASNGAIVFHIGGFKSPNNTIRTVSPTLNGATIQIRDGRTPEVHLKANVLKMFSGPNTIRFATLSNSMGGPGSVLVANNQAAGMFTVDHIHGN